MSNQNENDYEKQFRDDLAKATALSLEQQALDDFNRSKKYAQSSVYYEDEHKSNASNLPGAIQKDEMISQYYAQLRQRQQYVRSTSIGNTEEYVKGLQNQHSVVSLASTNAPASISCAADNDLISFNSPTSQNTKDQQTFQQLIDDLDKMQTVTSTQTALVPLRPTTSGTTATVQVSVYSPAPTYMPSVNVPYVGGLQLVPFTPSPQAQKMPLTNEHLQRLYSMSYGQHYAPPPPSPPPPIYTMGFVTPPIASAAYMPPQYPRYAYKYTPSGTFTTTTTPNKNGSITSTYTQTHSQSGSAGVSSNFTASVTSNGHNSASGVSGTFGSSVLRRSSRPVASADLIDLNQDDDSRVSVLEAFDPLLNEGDAVLKN